MGERILWLLGKQLQYASGAQAPREQMGVFSTPDVAFGVVRDHPDFQGVEVAWQPVEWDHGSLAYFGLARKRSGRDVQLWELSLVPAVVDEPIFDFRDEREAFERNRRGRGHR